MKIYYMRQEILENLKNNIDSNIENYRKDSNNWIEEKYQSPFLEYRTVVEDFELIFDPKDVGSSDMENVKILHSNLRFLSKTEASDERLWAGLTHSVFWDFMNKRWSTRPVKEKKDILNRYFVAGDSSSKKSLLLNTIARYWWVGELIYDENNREDPYHLIEVFRGDFTTSVHTFFTSNFTSNFNIVKGVLKPLLDYKEANKGFSRDQFRATIRNANLIGGSYLLDYLSAEEIESKIRFFIENTFIEETKEESKKQKNIKDMPEPVENKQRILSKIKDSLLGKK